jgi:MFS family permease
VEGIAVCDLDGHIAADGAGNSGPYMALGYKRTSMHIDAVKYTHFIAGIIVGGIISDKIVIRSKSGANRLWLQITGILLAAPCIALMGLSHNLVIVCGALAGFGLFRGLFECSTYPVLYDVISPKYYSLSSAIMILFGFSIGALAPWILGVIGDSMGLSKGFIILAAVWASVSIALITARLRFYNRDLKRS